MPRKYPKHELSIDPGIANTGVALFRDGVPVKLWHFITKAAPKKKRDTYKTFEDFNRVIEVMDNIRRLMTDYNPVVCYAELPVGGARSSAAVKYLAMATAVVAHIQHAYEIPVRAVTPFQLKEGFMQRKKVQGKGPLIRKALKDFPDLNWPRKKNGELVAPANLEHLADAIGAYYAWSYFND